MTRTAMRTTIFILAAAIGTAVATPSLLPAQGSFFRTVQSGQPANWRYPSAMLVRTYIMVSFATMRDECKAAPIRTPFDSTAAEVLADVFVRPSHNALPFVTAERLRNSAWMTTNDAEADTKRYLERASCSPAAQRAWTRPALAMLADKFAAASIEPVARSACETFSLQASDCVCFARWFDRESSPAERRAFLAGADTLAGLRAALADANFAARATWRCGTAPEFPSRRLTADDLRSDDPGHVPNDFVMLLTELRSMSPGQRQAINQAHSLFQHWPAPRGPAVPMHRCHYGPDPRKSPPYQPDISNTVAFLYPGKGPTQAQIAEALAGNLFLAQILELGRARRSDCPPTLTEARALKANMVEDGEDAAAGEGAAAAAGRTTPAREATPPSRTPVAGETRAERTKRQRCEFLEGALPRMRALAAAGRYPKPQLARMELEYRTTCRDR